MSPLEMLEEALVRLQDEDLSALAPAEALCRSERLHRAATQLSLLRLQSVADVEARSLYIEAGAPTTSAWLSGLDADYDRREVALAKKLSMLPLVSAEIAAGRLPMSAGKIVQTALSMLRRHVDRPDGLIDGVPGEAALTALLLDGVRVVVAEARGGLSDAELHELCAELRAIVEAPSSSEPVCGGSQVERLEAAFLVVARWVEPHQLRSALGVLVGGLLPQVMAAAAARAMAERGVTLVRCGGGWRLEGDLDLETGEMLFTFLDAEMRRDEDNPRDTAAAAAMREKGLDPSDPDDLVHSSLRSYLAGPSEQGSSDMLPAASVIRSRRQRMHDALRNGVARYLGAALGGVADKVPVHVSVTVGVEQLAGEPGALPARSSSGSLVPTALLERWMCDSAVTRFVMSLRGLVMEASHTERTTKAHERRAKKIETGGQCQCMGCRTSTAVPGAVLIPHHVYGYARHGVTSHRETVLLCPASHHAVHEGGKTIQLKDGRWLNADGWVSGPSANGPPGEIAA
jgi:hypothetical protein